MFSDSVSSAFPRLRWPVLKPVGGDPDSPFVRVNRVSCVVGDRSPVHLPLRSPMVSRTHALIIVDEDEVYIRDLASSNRLYINGSAVREAPLRTSDLLQIGPFRFRCHTGFSKDRPTPAPEAGADRPMLVFAGSQNPRPIGSRTFVIGRRPECDLPLGSHAVSQVHAVIFRRGNAHFIRDLNSRFGTIVNGRRVRETELKDGDEMRIATAMLTFRLDAAEVYQPAEVDASEGSGSWLAAELWSSSPGGLSLSKSVGAQTMPAAEDGAEPTEPQPLNLEAPDATPEDLGLEQDVGSAGACDFPAFGSDVEFNADPGLASAAELFSYEINLSGGRIFKGAGIDRVVPPRIHRQENEY